MASKALGCSSPSANETPVPDERIRDTLLWARQNNFRIRELEVDGFRVVVDDLGEPQPAEKPSFRTAHEAFAQQFGIPYSEDGDEG